MDYSVLRENDIRGVYGKNITEDLSLLVGKAFGTYLINNKKLDCVVGYDNRVSGDVLVEKLMEGIRSTGINVIFIGMVTTPLLNYATIELKNEAGIIVTASHNPANENGFKLFGDKFLHLKHSELIKVYELIKNKTFKSGSGNIKYINMNEKYITMMSKCINPGNKKIKMAIDPGNGTTSLFIKDIIKKYKNITPIYINDYSDGNFPVHNPDPNNDNNLKELKELVIKEKCDFGAAYDGDGDRIGIVDNLGNTIESDKLIALFARDIIPKTNNKKVLIDVKCSKALKIDIENLNAEAIMVKNGSAFIETEMNELDVLIGGEYSGHIFFRDRHYGYDDGIYASLRMYELLTNTNKLSSELLEGYTHYFNTPEIRVKTTDEKKWKIVDSIKNYVKEKKYNFIDIDGVRVEFKDGWALIRCSNTEPSITMRFEAETNERLKEIKMEFEDLVNTKV